MNRFGRRSFVIALAVTAAAALIPAPVGGAGTPAIRAARGPFSAEPNLHECLEPVPEAASVSGVTDDGQTITLDVLVLLDGISRSRGGDVMETAARAYRPLDIDLQTTFRRVRFRNSGEYHEMERAALEAVGGKRPRRFDVVYVMTAKDIHSQGDYSIAGFAFCIGGVRDPRFAFAVGEGLSPYEAALGDPTFSAKIAAHELGHLLGAHHHYGNCAEGDRSTEGGGEPSFCTLMWTVYVRFMSLNFGTLEAAVVRGHAVQFAAP
ncbi:MAG TPA: zinc-dependent metalloprotease family protein [Actinomycetota bacterium]|nr:zinc-dependent metalloprotease family protein [Actinomycetota bacterium]